MRVFIILDTRNRVRGFPYVERKYAEEAVKEADFRWGKEAGPHRIVPFRAEPEELLGAKGGGEAT